MTMKFYGTFTELQQIIADLGITGTWSGKDPAEFAVVDKSATLRWWPSTGTLYIQGKPNARDAFTVIVAKALPSVELPWSQSASKGSKS